ncbi:hypothetical protein BDW75DRAFT_240953 [Aspergillus navahoensis]
MPALSKLKKSLVGIKEKWGPLMAAKEDGDEEYNFPAGGGPRFGQGKESSDQHPLQNEAQDGSTDGGERTNERARRSPDLAAIAE